MFQPWRVLLRQAEEALDRGQLDEAGRLLARGDLREFQPSQKLQARLADQLAQRGRNRAVQGETQAGWRDWETAVLLGAQTQTVQQLEAQLVEQTLAEVASYLDAGQGEMACTRLDDLSRRRGDLPAARKLRHVAAKIDAAQKLERQGKFTEAVTQWEAAMALDPQLKSLPARRDAARERGAQWRGMSHRLHELLAREDSQKWHTVLTLADEMLTLAPDDAPAKDARRRAWAAVGTPLPESAAPQRGRAVPPPLPGAAPLAVARVAARPATIAPALAEQRDERFLMWVDAVGGYLVCLGDHVVLGQPSSDQGVDVPILADLGSRHAIIHRSGEGYLMEPLRPTRLDGKEVQGPVALADGAVIELGSAVRLRFRKPHPLSATARLEFVSRHRTQPPTDGVLLMADACILGPTPGAHVTCPTWKQEAVLFRADGALRCRTAGSLEIDGKTYEATGPLTTRSHVTGDDLAFSLEPLAS